MKLSIGFSPCPNDTFIFDAIVNNKIDTQGIKFEVRTEDVQQLNTWALDQQLDVSKISYGVLPLLLDSYNLLTAGGALGFGVGPILICKDPNLVHETHWENMKIAIPGKNTTAHLLFSLAYPNVTNKSFLLFSEIEKAVLDGLFDAGVIIHENRFTYQEKGLSKITDLGDFWEKKTGNPIPLGGIVIKKTYPLELGRTLNKLIQKSIEYAYQHHYDELADYVKCNAQEMLPSVMKQHINLYVNQYSSDLGELGKKAVKILLETYNKNNPHSVETEINFIGD